MVLLDCKQYEIINNNVHYADELKQTLYTDTALVCSQAGHQQIVAT
jgi:hypothetical protein